MPEKRGERRGSVEIKRLGGRKEVGTATEYYVP
jgi:hypothetical protein